MAVPTRSTPARAPLPNMGLGMRHPDRSNGRSSQGHRLSHTILHWRGWPGGCFALYGAIGNSLFGETVVGLVLPSRLLTQIEFSLHVLFEAYLVMKRGGG